MEGVKSAQWWAAHSRNEAQKRVKQAELLVALFAKCQESGDVRQALLAGALALRADATRFEQFAAGFDRAAAANP
jgi:hypothetical protein